MGLTFTLIYLLYMYVSPASWIPWLATITVQPFVAAVASLCTLPRFLDRSPFKVSPQLLLFLVFSAYVALSPALQGWFGGIVEDLPTIAAPAFLLFLVPLNCDSTARRRILVIALVCAMLGLVLPGIRDYHVAPEQSKFVMGQTTDEEVDTGEEEAPPALYRLKAQGLVDDPNDFAQLLLVTLSLSFLWWSRNWLTNVLFVLLPGAILMYGVYLTHSRGALVAIAVMAAVAFRRRLKWLGSLAVAGVFAFALLATEFTGGREINLSESGGADRLVIWSEGWELFKQSPLLGSGYGSYMDAVSMTAHNSFLLVAVEAGLLGLVLWVSVFVISFDQLKRVVTPTDGTPPDPVLRREAVCLEVALTAFLATSWFLSRAYQPVSFLLVGLLGGLVYQESLRRPNADLMRPWRSCLIRSLAASVASLVLLYVMVRLRTV